VLVIDTHVLVWWVNGSHQLSNDAAESINAQLSTNGEIIISAISAWEISMLIQKGKLVLSMDLDIWLSKVAEIVCVRFMPVDTMIGVKSTLLPGDFHKDPADRIIVATAREFAAPLVTADEKIINYPHVATIW